MQKEWRLCYQVSVETSNVEQGRLLARDETRDRRSLATHLHANEASIYELIAYAPERWKALAA